MNKQKERMMFWLIALILSSMGVVAACSLLYLYNNPIFGIVGLLLCTSGVIANTLNVLAIVFPKENKFYKIVNNFDGNVQNDIGISNSRNDAAEKALDILGWTLCSKDITDDEN